MPGAVLAKFPVLKSLRWEIPTLHRALCPHKKNKKAKQPKNSAALWKNCYENEEYFVLVENISKEMHCLSTAVLHTPYFSNLYLSHEV